MISSEAQRKLVKSPPELWAELSDPAALARHLGDLGEIRITKTEPERSVEWEAEAASGKVELKPSGWGTQVTLTVTRELPDLPAAAEEHEPAPPPEPVKSPETPPAAQQEPEPSPAIEPEPAAAIEPALATEHVEPAQEEPTPRRGFFARLFRRRSRAKTPTAAEAPASSASPTVLEAPEIEHEAERPAQATTGDAVPPAPAKEAAAEAKGRAADLATPDLATPDLATPDLAAELAAAEEAIAKQTTELLNGVLDRLGAAHHRPFSRA